MNPWLIAASSLLVLTALIHSLLGERLIFSRLRASGWVPTEGGTLLQERHVRILWATWHLVSVLGACVAAVLAMVAFDPLPAASLSDALAAPHDASADTLARFCVQSAAIAAWLGSALVLIGTRGRHPGWLSLLLIGLSCQIGLA
jgi:hypothetical protein